jgi:hypothetical protein
VFARRIGRSESDLSTNWNEELQPEQTADRPPGEAEISRGAPHKLQGGPVGDSDPSAASPPFEPGSGVRPAPRPASTTPSSIVKEWPQPAQDPVSNWAGWVANSIAEPQSGQVPDTGNRPNGAGSPSLAGLPPFPRETIRRNALFARLVRAQPQCKWAGVR